MAEVLLYGLVDAERLFFDPAEVYECDIEPVMDQRAEGVEIEEWSTHEPDHHLPTAEHLLEWMGEWTADCGEVDEGWHDKFNDIAKTEPVLAAAETLRAAIAGPMNYRMAKDRLRTLLLTWDENGEPLIDGGPLYVPVEAQGG